MLWVHDLGGQCFKITDRFALPVGSTENDWHGRRSKLVTLGWWSLRQKFDSDIVFIWNVVLRGGNHAYTLHDFKLAQAFFFNSCLVNVLVSSSSWILRLTLQILSLLIINFIVWVRFLPYKWKYLALLCLILAVSYDFISGKVFVGKSVLETWHILGKQ